MKLMKRCEIDPNVRVGRNGTFTGFEDCSEVPDVYERVWVYESEANIGGFADVSGIDHAKGLVFLSLDWSELSVYGHDSPVAHLEVGKQTTAAAPSEPGGEA